LHRRLGPLSLWQILKEEVHLSSASCEIGGRPTSPAIAQILFAAVAAYDGPVVIVYVQAGRAVVFITGM
jgi:hypothetical protein